MSKTYILYHSPCSDGLGARYAAWKKFGDNAEYIGVNYGEPVPDLNAWSDVYIIDFSYPKAILEQVKARMNKLIVLDHHKTAMEDLKDLPYAIFDMNKSGAVLAWEYFHPGVPIPTLLEMIQDRDLWKWRLPGTRNVLNYLTIHGDDVSTWDELIPLRGYVFGKGEVISKYQDKLIESGARDYKLKFVVIDGKKVGITNTTVLPSEIGARICEEHDVDYSATYFISKDGEVCLSFRSKAPHGFDVSAVAKSLGGGGHKHASGARMSLTKLQEWLGE